MTQHRRAQLREAQRRRRRRSRDESDQLKDQSRMIEQLQCRMSKVESQLSQCQAEASASNKLAASLMVQLALRHDQQQSQLSTADNSPDGSFGDILGSISSDSSIFQQELPVHDRARYDYAPGMLKQASADTPEMEIENSIWKNLSS